jgi:hypothetical protein
MRECETTKALKTKEAMISIWQLAKAAIFQWAMSSMGNSLWGN